MPGGQTAYLHQAFCRHTLRLLTGKGMLEYVAAREQALASQVSASHLARLAAGGQLALFINGWNEIGMRAVNPA